MSDSPGKNGGSPVYETSPKEEEQALTLRIKEGVGRQLKNFNTLRTKAKSKLIKSLSHDDQVDAKREDAEKELPSRSMETGRTYSHTTLSFANRDYHQSQSSIPDPLEQSNFARASSPMSPGIPSKPRHAYAKASETVFLKSEIISDAGHIITGPYSVDMSSRKQQSYSPDNMLLLHPRSNLLGSRSGKNDAPEDGPSALAAGVLVSPCLETKEMIFSHKPHLHHSDPSLHPDSPSPDDTLRLAVPLFTKDVHMAYKNVLRQDSTEAPKPPPEKILPKSTIIVNRFGVRSPYIDISKYSHAHTRDKKAAEASRYSPEAASPDTSHSPQRPAPVSFVDAAHARAQYVMPLYLPSPMRPFTSLPIPPPSLSAPPLMVPQQGYFWAPHPSAPPMAPMSGQRAHYSREELPGLGNYRQRHTASSFSEKLSSCFPYLFGAKQPVRQEDSPHRLPSYSQHQASLSNIFHNGAHRSSFTENQKRRSSRDCDPDELLMHMACCCCWPIGLAAKIITAVFPREMDSCVGYLARQLSVCALLLGIAIYLVIMVVLVSLVAALANGSQH